MFPGFGTLANSAMILAGSLLGLTLRKGIPDRFKVSVQTALAVSVVMIGLSGTLSGLFRTNPAGTLDRVDIFVLILALVLGAFLGELLRLDRVFDRIGRGLARLVVRSDDPETAHGVSKAFVEATLLYCVGAMAIVGAVEDGLSGDPSTLVAKGMLDGFISILMASTLGVGVALSAGSVLLYQGAVTLLAIFLKPLATPEILLQTSMVGSAVILCIGLNLLDITRIHVAKLLPATFMPALFALAAALARILAPGLFG